MAVVETLSVILQTLNAQFSKGLKDANKDLKGFEKQAAHTQRVMAGFSKGFATVGNKLGLGGVFGGAFGGFQFARFAKDSLHEHAKSNLEMKASLEELDASILQIKKNFGAWLADVAGANGIIQGFSNQLAELSGEGIKRNQAGVNAGRLDTNQTAGGLRDRLEEAKRARANLEPQLAIGGSPETVSRLQAQWKNLTSEIEIMERRLKAMQDAGQDFAGNLTNLPKFLDSEFKKGFEALAPMAEGFGTALLDGLKGAAQQLDKMDSAFQQLEANARDFMKGFKISEANMSPLEIFKKDTEELTRLFKGGFLKEADFDLALLDARREFEDSLGLDAATPGRVTGARRGSAEAFEKVAAFRDGTGNVIQRTLEESRDIAKEQLRLQREAAAKNRAEVDAIGTIDTKP